MLQKYDVLLIADEVVCGFGRTGAMFGSDLYGMEPDLVTVAKGLTSAYVPLSAAIVSQKVYDVMEEATPRVGSFSHGYTYSGHPIGAAAANAVLDIVEREDLAGQSATKGAYLLKRLKAEFDQNPIVGEVRGVGMLAAARVRVRPRHQGLVRSGDSKVGARISQAARNRNLIARAMPHGDILGFAPPLVMTEAEIDEMVAIAKAAVDEVLKELDAQGAVAG